MAINSIGSGFNPYTNSVTPQRGIVPANPGTTQRPATTTNTTTGSGAPQSVADAIKTDATARAAQVNSAQAPDGVDQQLWSVLSKEERSFFVKAGAMGPLTYGRFSPQAPQNVSAPLMRGGRLDIKA